MTLCLVAGPAAGWEFTPSPICTLRHTGEAAEVVVTYDASLPEYAISVRLLEQSWPEAPSFSIAYAGPYALTIATDRHEVSPDGTTLTVRDRGFGNVLNGLEFNATATARSGDMVVTVPLDEAAQPVQAFRACPQPATS